MRPTSIATATAMAFMLAAPLSAQPVTTLQQQQSQQPQQCGTDRPPRNGEFLQRRGTGPHRVVIENGGGTRAVVKMRNQARRSAATVFVGPHSIAQVDNFPSGRFRPEFATGSDWSRNCGMFMAGMRVQRYPDFDEFASRKTQDGRTMVQQARYVITTVANGNVTPESGSVDDFTTD